MKVSIRIVTSYLPVVLGLLLMLFITDIAGASVVPDTTLNTNRNRAMQFDSPGEGKGKDSVTLERNIFGFLGIEDRGKPAFAWYLDSKTYSLVTTNTFDTSLFLNHLIIPGQRNLNTFTYLGNMGAPIQSDHFFDRERSNPFVFIRGYTAYLHPVMAHRHFNVRMPHTRIYYTSAGKRKEAEQVLRVLHTQNVNRYLNIGLEYDYYNAKGIYRNQLTRDNIVSVFASYYRKRLSAQATFSYFSIKNKENGGITDDKFITDTVLEPSLVPISLDGASNELRQRSFAAAVGYDILVSNRTPEKENADTSLYRALLTAKLLFNADRYTKTYIDKEEDNTYYSEFYISARQTHDSVYLVHYNTTLLVEIPQLAGFPGVPGLRFWVANRLGRYWYFEPAYYIYSQPSRNLHTNHLGAAVYSNSPYLSYSAALRYYLNGYLADNKELIGSITISPWKSTELPYIKGSVEMATREPDLFTKRYFSNHYRWDNRFEKEQRFVIKGVLGADRIKLSIGYNLAHIVNYTYFGTDSKPNQQDNITVSSAYVAKQFTLGPLNLLGKVLWQATTHAEILSLPRFSGFGSIYFQFPVVKNVLKAQVGLSAFYRTAFYADAYNPATGQFYLQREKKIGDYPFVDLFVNLRWKRTLLFFKMDHVNQGIPDNSYFTALHYPANQRVFKFGLSWMFYD